MSKGFDTVSDLTSHGQQILDAGYTWVARYTFNVAHSIKTKLTYDEAKHLSGMGLYVVNVWQNAANQAAYFTSKQGALDGEYAFGYARGVLHQPPATPVYFPVDYDAGEQDLNQRIIPYFQSVRGHMGANLVGVYGSGFVCRMLKEMGLVHFTWLAQSPGWAEADYPDYNLRQLMPSKTFAGLSIDEDLSNGDGGGWKIE